jgi:alkylhydroperoxidase/carboxymuconolactone decarboxylase family protein YurZ
MTMSRPDRGSLVSPGATSILKLGCCLAGQDCASAKLAPPINPEAAEISDKLKALLNIAGKVQKGGKQVNSDDVTRARQHGATDKEIHDTVLIAAAFCMYNRYVDGLATWQPQEPDDYTEMGERMAHEGYGRARQPSAQGGA